MSTGILLVFGASLFWIMLCMRFWWTIDRDNVWQRRLIAIGAGLGGGLIYFIGSMMLDVIKPGPPPSPQGQEIRITPGAPVKGDASTENP